MHGPPVEIQSSRWFSALGLPGLFRKKLLLRAFRDGAGEADVDGVAVFSSADAAKGIRSKSRVEKAASDDLLAFFSSMEVGTSGDCELEIIIDMGLLRARLERKTFGSSDVEGAGISSDSESVVSLVE